MLLKISVLAGIFVLQILWELMNMNADDLNYCRIPVLSVFKEALSKFGLSRKYEIVPFFIEQRTTSN